MATAAAALLGELSRREKRSESEKGRIDYFTNVAAYKLAASAPLVSGEKFVTLPEASASSARPLTQPTASGSGHHDAAQAFALV